MRAGLTWALICAAVAATALPANVTAQVVDVQGALHATGGGAAPDGFYLATFTLYEAKQGGVAFWSEPNQQLKVTGGRFSHRLGSANPLSAAILASKKQVWLGVKLGLDPELPRTRVDATPFSLVAQTAMGLACTGCVSVKSLKADGDLHLGNNVLTASKVTAQQLVAGTATAQKFVGDGSGLTNIKMPKGYCKSGEAVVGIAADGSLKCTKVASETAGGSLEKVSNGAISNIFNNEFKSTKTPFPIADNNPLGTHDTITVPDIGNALALSVLLELENSGINFIRVELVDPKGAKHVLYDKGSVGTKLLATFPAPVKPVSGDLTTWVGKNPKGDWKLSVYDTGFKNNGQDGQVVRWTIATQTQSNNKIQVKGDLVVGGQILAGKSAFPTDTSKCGASNRANVRYDAHEGMQICDGSHWVAALPQPVFFQGTCTHNGATSYRYFCLNHATYNTAQRYFTVNTSGTGTSTSSNTGRITFKIGGYYEVDFTSFTNTHYKRAELRRNGKSIGEVRQYEGSNSHNTIKLNKIVRFNPGDYMNIYQYASHNINWDGMTVVSGAQRFARSTWLRVRYIGTHWKVPKCGDGIVDIGEGCDDGNSKDDDKCNNKCVPNITGGVLTNYMNGNPTKTMGTITGLAGKRIRITKIAQCGDSTPGSGPNRFRAVGGGINFTWAAGRSSGYVSSNHWIGHSPNITGAGKGFVYKSVNYTASVGASVTVSWDYHYDWDGYYCHATDEDGVSYKDPSSSIRGWVKYEYVK